MFPLTRKLEQFIQEVSVEGQTSQLTQLRTVGPIRTSIPSKKGKLEETMTWTKKLQISRSNQILLLLPSCLRPPQKLRKSVASFGSGLLGCNRNFQPPFSFSGTAFCLRRILSASCHCKYSTFYLCLVPLTKQFQIVSTCHSSLTILQDILQPSGQPADFKDAFVSFTSNLSTIFVSFAKGHYAELQLNDREITQQ